MLRGGDRLGIYFAESGASQRASTVVYDRAHSAISDIDPAVVDWTQLMRGASWFHVSGITPALGPKPARCVADALAAARAAKVTTSFDLNFRRKLWSPSEAQATLRPLMKNVNLVIANEEDLQSALGFDVPGVDVKTGRVNAAAYRDVTRQVCELGPTLVAITLRESISASDNGWSAIAWRQRVPGDAGEPALRHPHRRSHRRRRCVRRRPDLRHSRPGNRQWTRCDSRSLPERLKHTIPGDFNCVSVEEVERLARGDASGRVQR